MSTSDKMPESIKPIDKHSYAVGLKIGKETRMKQCIKCNNAESILNDYLCYSCKHQSGMVDIKILLFVIAGMLFLNYLSLDMAYREIDNYCQVSYDSKN